MRKGHKGTDLAWFAHILNRPSDSETYNAIITWSAESSEVTRRHSFEENTLDFVSFN